ncbi:hypothetical protein AX14_012265 [Amanita brunnescens Koide BX004]|nr:hypothetical protein AX14_012265 [Amanita brunnescens Koide BX004]
MALALRLSVAASHSPRRTLSQFAGLTRSKWSLDGIPRPKPILQDDPDEHSQKLDLSEDNDIVNGARPGTPPPHERTPPESPTPYEHKTHRETLQKLFPAGWSPPKKLSRQAMDGLRQLHRFDSETFTTPVLADKFRISPEAVRRILKSKWEPSREKRIKLVEREREAREERIRQSRLKELQEAKEVAALKRAVERPASAGGRGVVIKDGLTFA